MADDRYLGGAAGPAFATGLLQALAQQDQASQQRIVQEIARRAAEDQSQLRSMQMQQITADQSRQAEQDQLAGLALSTRFLQPGQSDSIVAEIARRAEGTPYAAAFERTLPSSSPSVPMSGPPSFDAAGVPGLVVPGPMSIEQNTPESATYRGTPQERQAHETRQFLTRLLSDPTIPDEAKQSIRARMHGLSMSAADFRDQSDTVNWTQFNALDERGNPGVFERNPRTGETRRVPGVTPMPPATLEITQALADLKIDAARREQVEKDRARQAARSEVRELAESIITDPALNGITGAIEGRRETFWTGAAVDVKRRLDQLVNKLSVEARGKLKGQGQISDYEGRMLAQSVSALDRAAGPDIVRRHLQSIIDVFSDDAPVESSSPTDPAPRGGSDAAGVRRYNPATGRVE